MAVTAVSDIRPRHWHLLPLAPRRGPLGARRVASLEHEGVVFGDGRCGGGEVLAGADRIAHADLRLEVQPFEQGTMAASITQLRHRGFAGDFRVDLSLVDR